MSVIFSKFRNYIFKYEKVTSRRHTRCQKDSYFRMSLNGTPKLDSSTVLQGTLISRAHALQNSKEQFGGIVVTWWDCSYLEGLWLFGETMVTQRGTR